MGGEAWGSYDRGVAEGKRQAERETVTRICEWLRKQHCESSQPRDYCAQAADAIERGDWKVKP